MYKNSFWTTFCLFALVTSFLNKLTELLNYGLTHIKNVSSYI